MDWHVWLAYFVASWVIAVSPGSGAVLAMSHGLAYGVRGASATVLGLQIGLAFILLVAGAGVGAVLVASAGAFMVVKLLGAAYLLWLGFKQWRAPVTLDDGGAQAGPPVMRLRQRVLTGALTNATNPKGIVFMVAVLPQFIDPKRPLLLQLLILLVTTLAVARLRAAGVAPARAAALGAGAAHAEPRVRRRADGHGRQPADGGSRSEGGIEHDG